MLQDTITMRMSARSSWDPLYVQNHSLVMEGGALVGSSQAIFSVASTLRALRALHHIVSDQTDRDLRMDTHLWVIACHPLAKPSCGEKG
jgi:hypothetical protein